MQCYRRVYHNTIVPHHYRSVKSSTPYITNSSGSRIITVLVSVPSNPYFVKSHTSSYFGTKPIRAYSGLPIGEASRKEGSRALSAFLRPQANNIAPAPRR